MIDRYGHGTKTDLKGVLIIHKPDLRVILKLKPNSPKNNASRYAFQIFYIKIAFENSQPRKASRRNFKIVKLTETETN
mgnify:FL=1